MLFYVRDRKKVVAKKTVNTIQKQNAVVNGRGNAVHPIPDLDSREKIQNGANERELRGPVSVALSKGDAVVASQREEAPSDKISRSNTNGTIPVDKFAFKMDPSSFVPSTKDPLKEHSVGNKNESCSTVDAAKNITHNKSIGVVEEPNTSAIILANTEMQQESLHNNESSDSVMIPSGGKDNGKGSSSESDKKAPNGPILGILSGGTCKTDCVKSEVVFCSF